LKSGSSNASDIEGGVLQRSNIHIAVCAQGANDEITVTTTLNALKASLATTKTFPITLAFSCHWLALPRLNKSVITALISEQPAA
jgi:hypothetical protein